MEVMHLNVHAHMFLDTMYTLKIVIMLAEDNIREHLNLLNQGAYFKAQLHCCSSFLCSNSQRYNTLDIDVSIITNHVISHFTHLVTCVQISDLLTANLHYSSLPVFLLVHLQTQSFLAERRKKID